MLYSRSGQLNAKPLGRFPHSHIRPPLRHQREDVTKTAPFSYNMHSGDFDHLATKKLRGRNMSEAIMGVTIGGLLTIIGMALGIIITGCIENAKDKA